MTYIRQAFKAKHEWWRYLLGFVITIVGIGIFSMPHMMAIGIKQFRGEVDLARLEDFNYLMTLFEPNLNLAFLLLPFAGGLLFLFLAVKLLHKQTLKSLTTSRSTVDWKRIWTMFFAWGILSSGLVLLDYMMSPENYVLNFNLKAFAILALIAIVLVPLQTSCEEYLFRGYFMQGLGVITGNKWLPLVITSVVFGLMHLSNPEVDKLGNIIMIYYIGTGFFLGIMTLMDEGLELAIGFHAANNLFTALLVTADWTAFQTNSILKDISDPVSATFSDVLMPVFIMFPIILFILSRIYGWTNWREKLSGKVEPPIESDYKVLE